MTRIFRPARSCGDVTEAVLEEGDNEHTLILQLAGQVSAQFTVEVLINVINVIEQEGQAHIAPLGSVLGQNVIGSNSQIQSAQRNGVQNLFLRAQSVCGEDVDDVLAAGLLLDQLSKLLAHQVIGAALSRGMAQLEVDRLGVGGVTGVGGIAAGGTAGATAAAGGQRCDHCDREKQRPKLFHNFPPKNMMVQNGPCGTHC